MKSGKGSAQNRSGKVGGSKDKGKRRKVVNTNVNTSTSSNNKSTRQSRHADKRNGNNDHDSNSSGRQWINGEDTRHNKSFKRNLNEKAKRGYRNSESDDRPFNVNSISSTSHSSQNNTFRKRRGYEEDKER